MYCTPPPPSPIPRLLQERASRRCHWYVCLVFTIEVCECYYLDREKNLVEVKIGHLRQQRSTVQMQSLAILKTLYFPNHREWKYKEGDRGESFLKPSQGKRKIAFVGSPGLVNMGGDSWSRGRGFESRQVLEFFLLFFNISVFLPLNRSIKSLKFII